MILKMTRLRIPCHDIKLKWHQTVCNVVRLCLEPVHGWICILRFPIDIHLVCVIKASVSPVSKFSPNSDHEPFIFSEEDELDQACSLTVL